jgi:type VI protein secretion system component Hcp
MAFEYILLVPNLGAHGKTLREKLISLNLGGMMQAGTGGTSGGRSNVKDLGLTVRLNEDTHNFFTKAHSGETIPAMRIEVNEVTATTLKTAIVYDFTDLTVASYHIIGSHSKDDAKPTAFFSMIYETVKVEFMK